MKMFLIFLVSMLVIDAFWLGFMMNRFYAVQIGHLLAPKPNFIAAAAFYLIYVLGVTIFVLHPGGAPLEVFLKGALYGIVTYATYDITNHATLKDWPLTVTFVDITWGALLTGTLCVSTDFLASKF